VLYKCKKFFILSQFWIRAGFPRIRDIKIKFFVFVGVCSKLPKNV
jgi:hypothetical protein